MDDNSKYFLYGKLSVTWVGLMIPIKLPDILIGV